MRKIHLVVCGVAALAGFLPQSRGSVDLGSAAGFAVLGGATVVNTGATVLNGNLGVYPGSRITGFPPGSVNGTSYDGGAVAQQAANDASVAYATLSGEPVNQYLSGLDLGGLTLAPGVYNFSTAAQLTGQLTLDAGNDPNAQFIFQIGSTLTTISGASMVLENGAQAANVFWQVGTSATLGTGSEFDGSIIAGTSITMDTGAGLEGNALALGGAVTLDDNDISIDVIPESNPLWAVPLGVGLLAGGRWLIRRRGRVVSGGGQNRRAPTALPSPRGRPCARVRMAGGFSVRLGSGPVAERPRDGGAGLWPTETGNAGSL